MMAPDFRPFDPVPLDARELQALRRHVEALWALGPRALFEYELEQMGETPPSRRPWKWRRLEAYSALDADAVATCGGDHFPASPTLRLVPVDG